MRLPLSVLGAALYGIDVPKDSILMYETAVKSGKFILVYHGGSEEVEKAREILTVAKAAQVTLHSSEPMIL